MSWPAWIAVAAGLLLWPAPSRARLRWRALVRPSATEAAGPSARCRWPVRRRRGVDDATVLRAVRALQAELAAGARPGDALAAVAGAEPALAGSLGEAARAAAGAGDVGGVLAREPVLRGLATAWTLADTAGVPLGTVLDGIAADLARRVEQRQAVTAALAAPRSAAVLLAALPLLGLLLAAGMGARPLAFLTGSPAGRLAGGLGLLLDVAGTFWTLRLARGAQRA